MNFINLVLEKKNTPLRKYSNAEIDIISPGSDKRGWDFKNKKNKEPAIDGRLSEN